MMENPKYSHAVGWVAGPKECGLQEELPPNWSEHLNGCKSPFIGGPDKLCDTNGSPVPPAQSETDCMAACCADPSCKVLIMIHFFFAAIMCRYPRLKKTIKSGYSVVILDLSVPGHRPRSRKVLDQPYRGRVQWCAGVGIGEEARQRRRGATAYTHAHPALLYARANRLVNTRAAWLMAQCLGPVLRMRWALILLRLYVHTPCRLPKVCATRLARLGAWTRTCPTTR